MTSLVFWNRLSRKICKALKERNISHKEMAEELGLTPMQFSARVHGAIQFSVFEVYQIAEECLISVDEFFKD